MGEGSTRSAKSRGLTPPFFEDDAASTSITLARRRVPAYALDAVKHRRTPSSKAPAAKPTVLLADDDAGVLKAVARTLATDFDVVAAVGDGIQALDAVARLDPDFAVLDVSMPRLNGFQTARELRRLESRAAIVFLTMHDGDDYVLEAIRTGANGYVLKDRAWSDLPAALGHVREGRRFLPALTPLAIGPGGGHAVQIHAEDRRWLDDAARLLGRSLDRGDTLAVFLTDRHREAVALRMKAHGWDLAAAERAGCCVAIDAAESLKSFMRDGRVDADALADMANGLERTRQASARGPESRLTVMGEIAAVLCERGDRDAALELERLWDHLTRDLPFLTVCAYPIACIDGDPASALLPEICLHHSVVSHDLSA